jgi:hypothetical protein
MESDSMTSLITLVLLILLAVAVAASGGSDLTEEISDAAFYIIPSF